MEERGLGKQLSRVKIEQPYRKPSSTLECYSLVECIFERLYCVLRFRWVTSKRDTPEREFFTPAGQVGARALHW